MELKYLNIYCDSITIDEEYSESVSDKYLELKTNLDDLKLEVQINKSQLKNDLSDYFEILVGKLSQHKPIVEQQYLLIVQYWLDYYEMNFQDVLDCNFKKDFGNFFLEDDPEIFKENPSSKEFQVAFTKSICFKYYQLAVKFVLEMKFESNKPKVIPQNNNSAIKNKYINILCNVEDNELLNFREELGILYYYELVLGSFVALVKHEIEENIYQMDTPKILFYLDKIVEKIEFVNFETYNSLLLDSVIGYYDEKIENFPFLENKEIAELLQNPAKINEIPFFSELYNSNIIGAFVYHSLHLMKGEILGIINELKLKFSPKPLQDNNTIEIESNNEVIEDAIEVDEIETSIAYKLPDIFRGDNAKELFDRIFNELNIKPNVRGDQTRFMAIWEEHKVNDYIFKKAVILTDYLNFLNKKYDTKFNSKSKSKGGRYTKIAKDVYNLHIKEISEKTPKPS